MRGEFVFPGGDVDFMQLIEIRANNGATNDIETVYVLTGETYFVPTQLFAFDDPELYNEATANRVNVKSQVLARTVAKFYDERPGPKLIVWVHTHPSGGTQPSLADINCTPRQKRLYNQYFTDYELFLGIHGLKEVCDPDPDWLRQPELTADHEVSWWGENRKHSLALYDAHYEPRPVVIR